MDIEELLLAATRSADAAEVYSVVSESTPIQFETNRLKHVHSSQSTFIGLRLVKQGRIGYATATSTEDVRSLVNAALETAQFGTQCRFEFPGAAQYPRIDIFDETVAQVPPEKMVSIGEGLISAVRRTEPDLLCQAWVGKGTGRMTIINSAGGRAEYRQTHFSVSISGTLIRGTDMLFVGDSESSCRPLLDGNDILKTVNRQLEWARETATIPTGMLPVVFTPSGIASAFTGSLAAAFNGKTVLQGASPIGNRLGEKVFDSKLSLFDDPTLPYRPTSRPCDDEGIPSQRLALVEQGRVTSFLYDLQTAGLAGKRSTGSAARDRGQPSPSTSALVVTPGATSFNEMIANMKDGLVVEELMGAEQGNILGGDFSGNVLLGYRVERGRIVGRVKNTMVSGNIYQLLENIEAIGTDSKWVGNLLTPSLFFPRVSVASK